MNSHLAIRQFVTGGFALLGLLFLIGKCTACTEAKEVTAASAYEAQQMRCVEQYAKKADIDRCRMRVKLDWSSVDAGGGDS